MGRLYSYYMRSKDKINSIFWRKLARHCAHLPHSPHITPPKCVYPDGFFTSVDSVAPSQWMFFAPNVVRMALGIFEHLMLSCIIPPTVEDEEMQTIWCGVDSEEAADLMEAWWKAKGLDLDHIRNLLNVSIEDVTIPLPNGKSIVMDNLQAVQKKFAEGKTETNMEEFIRAYEDHCALIGAETLKSHYPDFMEPLNNAMLYIKRIHEVHDQFFQTLLAGFMAAAISFGQIVASFVSDNYLSEFYANFEDQLNETLS